MPATSAPSRPPAASRRPGPVACAGPGAASDWARCWKPGRGNPGGKARSTQKSAFNCSGRSEEHTSELQSQSNLVCRLLLEKKKIKGCDLSELKCDEFRYSRSTESRAQHSTRDSSS